MVFFAQNVFEIPESLCPFLPALSTDWQGFSAFLGQTSRGTAARPSGLKDDEPDLHFQFIRRES